MVTAQDPDDKYQGTGCRYEKQKKLNEYSNVGNIKFIRERNSIGFYCKKC